MQRKATLEQNQAGRLSKLSVQILAQLLFLVIRVDYVQMLGRIEGWTTVIIDDTSIKPNFYPGRSCDPSRQSGVPELDNFSVHILH